MVYNTGFNKSYYLEYLYDGMYNNNFAGGFMPQPGVFTQPGTGVIGLKPTKTPGGNNNGLIPGDKYAADDGKISAGDKLKNFGKGIVKFFTGMVCDETGKFSLKRTLRTAALAVGIGAVCVLTAGTAVPAMLAAGGVLASGAGLVKGAVRASKATTDAEAEAAWQSIGSSTTAFGLSLVAARSVAKGAHTELADTGRYDGAKGIVNGVKDVFVDSGTAIKNSAIGIKNAWQGAAGEGLTGRLSAVKDNIVHEQGKAFADQVKVNYNNSVTNIKNKIETKENKALEKKHDSYQAKADSAKTEATRKYWQDRADSVQRQINARREMNGVRSYDEGARLLEAQKAKVQELNQQLADASKSGSADQVATLKQQLQAENEILKHQSRILERKTFETNALEQRLSARQEKLDALRKSENPNVEEIAKLEQQIADIQTKIKQSEFSTARTSAREQNGRVADAQKGAENAQSNYDAAKLASDADRATLNQARADLETANKGLEQTLKEYHEATSKGKIDLAEAKLDAVRAKMESNMAARDAAGDYNVGGYEPYSSYGKAAEAGVKWGQAEQRAQLAQRQIELENQLRDIRVNVNQAEGRFTNAAETFAESSERFGNAHIQNEYAQNFLNDQLRIKADLDAKVAAGGPGTKGSPISQAAREILIDAKNNPGANWLTVEYGGRKQWYPDQNPIESIVPQQTPEQQNPWQQQTQWQQQNPWLQQYSQY